MVPVAPASTGDVGLGYEAPGTRFPYPFGCTRYLPSCSRSVGRSSKASSSVPSPYVRCRLGFFSTFGALVIGKLELWPCRDFTDLIDVAEGGRGGNGDVERADDGGRANSGTAGGAEVGKTLEIGARDFIRDDDVGIVSLRAAGFAEGVDGRVGGTVNSKPCIRLVVELVCAVFALDDAVGVS